MARLSFPGDREARAIEQLRRRPPANEELVSRTELAEIGVRLASNIKAWRLERGMTQKDIAEHLGVSYVMIYKFEKGKDRIPIQRMIQFWASLATSDRGAAGGSIARVRRCSTLGGPGHSQTSSGLLIKCIAPERANPSWRG